MGEESNRQQRREVKKEHNKTRERKATRDGRKRKAREQPGIPLPCIAQGHRLCYPRYYKIQGTVQKFITLATIRISFSLGGEGGIPNKFGKAHSISYLGVVCWSEPGVSSFYCSS
ncbi:hypothetical protein SLEP1_g24314 [Rubroshorea leprosula]|uniref:Uncharacterized protein n=1 Tax=Rubroshorea leprosula TaxID=152421 RepID=A0AAV5JF91_9ROSI|nr:hypothetical protein SLEP1_g24314 [Rubroshorea leprosula]